MVYYTFVAFWVGLSQLMSKSIFGTKIISYFSLVLMFILMVTVTILNPITADMARYLEVLNTNSNLTLFEALSNVHWEPGFVIYQWLLSQLSTSTNVFIGLTITIIWVILILSLKKVVSVKYIPLIMFAYLSFFYFYNFSMNVLRQGFTVSLMLLMIVYLSNRDYKKGIVVCFTALTFHLSSVIFLILFLVRKLNFSVKLLFIIFLISSLLMISGVNQNLFSGVGKLLGGGLGDAFNHYTSKDVISDYGASNRIDFFIFVLVWMIWGMWFYYSYLKKDLFYSWLVKFYISLSTIYILFGFIAYSDRLAAYAWFLIPIILCYPVSKMKTRNRNVWGLICVVICIAMYFFFDLPSLYEPLKLIY